jgi:PAS domain S-box-containing protein
MMSSSTLEENFLDEISSLRHTMRDLVALSALPVIWAGYNSERIAESLADVMLSILSLELIYLTFARKGATGVTEVARCSQLGDSAENRQAIGRAVAPWLNDPIGSVSVIPHPLQEGTVRIASARFGYVGDAGVIVAGSVRPDFPSEQERLLIRFGANQAAISIQQRRVARLYAELTHANEELKAEISERRRAEEALRRSEAYLSEAQRLSHTGSFGWDVSRGESYWSQETFRIFEYDPSTEPTLELALRRIHPEDRALVRQVIDRALHERKYFDLEPRLLMPDDSVKFVRVVGRPSTEDESGSFEFVGAVTDITERKQVEEGLQKAQAELAHVTRVTSLGELTASIAHEINQPLTAVVNNAGACLRWLAAQNLEEARRSASLVIADSHRAGEIIGRIRALAKKGPPQKDWLDLNETVGEVIAMARSELRRNRVSLQTKLVNDLPLILGDRIQLQQVILNLLINAVEAMSGVGEGPRELWVSSEKVTEIFGESEEDTLEDKALADAEWSHVLIAVRDSGPGLDSKGLDRLFDAFYTTKPQGLGMGLAISRSIIEAHRGRLWATANASQGAVFQFTLPIRYE